MNSQWEYNRWQKYRVGMPCCGARAIACEPERRHVSEFNPLHDAWSTVIFSYPPDSFFPRVKIRNCACAAIYFPLPAGEGVSWPKWARHRAFFISLQPSAINVNCTTATLPTIRLMNEDAYFIASMLVGQIPIGWGVAWAARRVWRAVREPPTQGDEEAANDQERDEIKDGITATIQCLRSPRLVRFSQPRAWILNPRSSSAAWGRNTPIRKLCPKSTRCSRVFTLF